MVSKIVILLKKDFLKEFRSFHQLGAVLAFLTGAAYLVYFFSRKDGPEEWNLLYWIVFLFVSFFTGYRVFEEDLGRYKALSHQLYDPFLIYLVKNLFLFILLNVLSFLLFFVFLILMPPGNVNYFDWLGLMLLFNAAVSVIFSFNSILSSQVSNQTLLFTVLVLPLVFPLFGAGYLTGLAILNGTGVFGDASQFRIIFGITLFAIALVFLILPFIWKN